MAELRSRAVRIVFELEGDLVCRLAAIASMAAKIGCTPEMLLTLPLVATSVKFVLAHCEDQMRLPPSFIQL